MIGRHKLDGLRLQNARTVQLPPIEQHKGKTEIIPSRTHQPATTGFPCIAPHIALTVARPEIALIVLSIQHSHAIALLLWHVKTRVGHIQRHKNTL